MAARSTKGMAQAVSPTESHRCQPLDSGKRAASRHPGIGTLPSPNVLLENRVRTRAHSELGVSAVKLEIWSDIACPWCYVGKRRFERALASFPERDSVEVTWRSFELDPSAPRMQPGSQAELLAKKYRLPLERAQEMNANMTAQGAKEGIEFNFDRVRMGNTFDAHRLIHFAASHGRRSDMVERLFRAYFTE